MFFSVIIIIIIIIHFFARVFSECTEAVATSLTNFPGICAFIIGNSFTVWTKMSAKKIRKQVTECLQSLYQSVAFHLKYVLLVLL